MQVYQPNIALLLRIALGVTLLVPVADRLGWVGSPGDKNSSWGSWGPFVQYTHSLNLFVYIDGATMLAILATSIEVGLGVLLIIGLFTRSAALGTSVLTTLFASARTCTLGSKAPINFSVWVDSIAALLLVTLPTYAYSVDAWHLRKRPSILF